MASGTLYSSDIVEGLTLQKKKNYDKQEGLISEYQK